MKISLFNSSYTTKVYIFIFTFFLITSTPLMAHASFFSMISDVFTGGRQAQAFEEDTALADGVIHNSQTIPLLESSIDPDIKNMKDTPSIMIIEDQALSANDVFTGIGLENISSGDIYVYEVQKGDTLSEIAEEFDVSVNTIRWENNISGQSIRVGQKLDILPVTGVKHIVKKGDNLGKIASMYDAELEDMLIYNGISKEDGLKIGDILYVPNGIIKTIVSKSTSSKSKSISSMSSNTKAPMGYFIRPSAGPQTSPYGSRRNGFHYGVDIGAKRGTPVVAAATGVIIKVVNYCVEGKSSCGGRYGNYITIEHSNGTRSRYAHLSSVLVFVGQEVNQGQLIAKSGNTGKSTGPHVHFEVENSNGSKMKPQF